MSLRPIDHDEHIVQWCYVAGLPAFQADLNAHLRALGNLQHRVQRDIDYWESVDFPDPGTLPTQAPVYQAVKFCGRVSHLGLPRIPASLAPHHLEIQDVTITDSSGGKVACIPVSTALHQAQLLASIREAAMMEFQGMFAYQPVRHGKDQSLVRRFHLLSMTRVSTTLQRVQATREEVERAKADIASHPDMFKYFQDELEKRLGIVALDKHPQLALAMKAIIIQAVAVGNARSNPGRVHSLVIGSPGVGKNLLVQAANLLNPIYTEATASKCTVAGLQSTARQGPDGYTAEPGLIPIADLGVFSIQDFHGVHDKPGILAVLTMAMEAGRLADGTAAKTTLTARTAIHLDLNRQTDLDPSHAVSSTLDDISMKLHVLSRFDFIIEIPRDPERQRAVMDALFDQNVLVGSDAIPLPMPKRDLLVLTAILRDQREFVKIPHELNHEIRAATHLMIDGLDHPVLGDFLARQAHSAWKLVCAHARLHSRDIATREDLDAVLPILEAKVTFIKNLIAQMTTTTPPKSAAGIEDADSRRAWIQSTFAGQTVTAKDVEVALKHAGATKASSRTTYRDLQELGEKGANGKWTIRKVQRPHHTANNNDTQDK